jgi:hypothetical protein
MKKSLLIFALIAFVLFTKGQTVNDVPLKDINTEYIQIVGTSKLLSTKLTIEIDFGQENKIFNGNDTQLKDIDGKRIVFNSMIDALNFMSANGYEFVQAYVITIVNQNVYHYLMRRMKTSEIAKK